MQRRFSQVDVFARGGFNGNPLAVVHDAEGLSTHDMQRITDWTNLSEATFLLPPTDQAADYRVRIFCPGRELPFAGHPTLGSAAAWLDASGTPADLDRIVQECGVGLVSIRRDADERLSFAAPPLIRSGPVEADLLAERLEQLGLTADDVLDSAWIDNGPGWLGLLLTSANAVLEVATPTASIHGFDIGLLGLHRPGQEYALEVRALFADARGSIREDPVTGSLNASAAQWLLGTGRIEAGYVAAQGRMIGRDGRVFVDQDEEGVWIGGHTTVSVRGTINC